MKNPTIGERFGELRVQCDRWPLTQDEPTPHVLTIVCVSMHTGKPNKAQIIEQLQRAITILATSDL